MRISCEKAGYYLQAKLIDWIREKVDDNAANWFEQNWTGPVKGRWLLGSGGVGLLTNNQSLEVGWRWDRHAIAQATQVQIF